MLKQRRMENDRMFLKRQFTDRQALRFDRLKKAAFVAFTCHFSISSLFIAQLDLSKLALDPDFLLIHCTQGKPLSFDTQTALFHLYQDLLFIYRYKLRIRIYAHLIGIDLDQEHHLASVYAPLIQK